ncbi:hypothetical protein PISL3812_08729 [Talaromyces islandicus]|uniref:DUF202 domain-containing protein n=1 Tax=Talaromyces islandicus TaxID=28573 RepID=A0A0U1M7X0_TALIS|nr:hypothetical protein PISL3812_08729 [Talaromyces islandicus]
MAETAPAAADGSTAKTLGDDATEQQRQSQSPSQNQTEEEEEEEEEGGGVGSLRRRLSTASTDSRPREATELDEITTASQSTASLSSGEYRVTPRMSVSGSYLRHRNESQRFQPLRRFWSRNIALVVEQKGNRDYFALERTFLAYTRTSATFSMQGVLIAQIFRLQSATHTRFDFRTVGVPLSIAYQCCAIVIAILGAYRFWRQQNAIARGKVVVGGWEINSMGFMTLLAGLVLLALAIAIIVELSLH